MATFDRVIPKLVQTPEAHARFVNTISLLEYTGARKILKSQRAENISADILAHAAEEIRHAQAFKKIALKMSNGALDSYSEEHLLCGEEARSYMQSIDRGVEKEIIELELSQRLKTNYLLTTLLVEERANMIYPSYDLMLSELGFPGVLKGILREESAHLTDIQRQLRFFENIESIQLDSLREIEEFHFSSWMKKIELYCWGLPGNIRIC